MNPAILSLVLLLSLIANGCATGNTRITTARTNTPETAFNFDSFNNGCLPADWMIRETGQPSASATWMVVADSTAPSKPNVLALTTTVAHGSTFNLAIADNISFKDLDLMVKVKAVTGEEDQGGGPIWRFKDHDNYYVCRFNPLEGNYRVYKVANGQRKQLDTASVKTAAGKWYSVRVTMIDNQIRCYLDGKKWLETKDDTFQDAGKVGLWTKADAATRFDDLVVRPIAKP